MATKTKKQKLTDTVKKMANKTSKPSKTNKDALKSLLLKEVKDGKEVERLKRVEANKNIPEITVYTKFSNPLCTQTLDKLKEEGISYIEKPHLEFEEEFSNVSLITGQAQFPTILVNGEYLVANRDFNQVPQLVEIIKRIGKKGVVLPPNDIRIVEGFKNMGLAISQQLMNLGKQLQEMDQKLDPITKFIDKLKEEIESEDA